MRVYYGDEEQNTIRAVRLHELKTKMSLILRLIIVIKNLGKIVFHVLQLLSLRLESSLQWLVLRVWLGIVNFVKAVMSIAHQSNSKRHSEE